MNREREPSLESQVRQTELNEQLKTVRARPWTPTAQDKAAAADLVKQISQVQDQLMDLEFVTNVKPGMLMDVQPVVMLPE